MRATGAASIAMSGAISGAIVAAIGGAAGAAPDPPDAAQRPAQAAPESVPESVPGSATGEHRWADGDHLTGEWDGARTALVDRGATIDMIYASDAFTARGKTAVLGHIEAALTVDTGKLGLWDGGTLYALVQNNHGHGINASVGSDQPVTNLETDPYTQLTELFVEQTALDERLRVRIGKQDANRDFGTPRFGGNFLNNDFGMYPNSPLPSYPTTGLGALVAGSPAPWCTGKLGIYEGSPMVGGLGLTTAFRDGAGYTVVGGAAVTHKLGADHRDGGTTSAGAWRQSGDIAEVDGAAQRTFDSNAGWFVQHDERIFLHPADSGDPRGLTVIVRASWARPDRTPVTRYAGGSAAWHGIGPRRNDTVGLGGGYLRIVQPLGGTPGPRDEWFVEAFYKLRLTSFASLQPDVQAFRHPGGDGANALVAGLRLKLKL